MTDEAAEPPPQPDPFRDIRDRFPELMREFRTIARRLLRRLPAPSLASGDLINEVFLKLVHEETRRLHSNRSALGGKPDAVLKACFGAACRDVMSVRWRRRERRHEVPFASERPEEGLSQFALADINELLSVLGASKPETAQIIEARVFGGLTVRECAEVFGVSPKTVDRRYALGRAWLKKELGGGVKPGDETVR